MPRKNVLGSGTPELQGTEVITPGSEGKLPPLIEGFFLWVHLCSELLIRSDPHHPCEVGVILVIVRARSHVASSAGTLGQLVLLVKTNFLKVNFRVQSVS